MAMAELRERLVASSIAAMAITKNPGLSNGEVAAVCGVSRETVRRARRDLAGDVPPVSDDVPGAPGDVPPVATGENSPAKSIDVPDVPPDVPGDVPGDVA